ncbi:MAG: beta-lactamase induction signal transducer [Pseudomonadota bacterium]
MSETTASVNETQKEKPRFLRAMQALQDRRMAAMLLLAFVAGLPYGAVLGLLNAWLTEVGITPATIGALSLVMLGYSFKYLWAPAFQAARPIRGMERLGGRRSWLIALQAAMVAMIFVFAFTDPVQNIGLVALLALAISLLSPTHDLILDAWRIEVARSGEDKDLMSALYQFGYKSAGFVTGFFALLMAARFGWTVVFIMISLFLAASMIGSIVAPEPPSDETSRAKRLSFLPDLPSRVSTPAIIVVSAGWVIAFGMIAWFIVNALILQTGASGRTFVRSSGPWIVLFTVILPACVSAGLVFHFKAKPNEIDLRDAPSKGPQAILGTLFRAIFDPLMELISRLRWGALLVLCLALTYRFTDAVWGSFAYPFYLGENFGAIGHTLDDVAIASKFFGVLATILGSLLGALMIAALGRMPVLFIGGIVAAATNLLYADLAAGAQHLDWFLAVSHLDAPLVAFAEWAAKLQVDVTAVDQGQRMARLMTTIFAENIAGGLALVAVMAYLTSVVNPRFAAVQYALLASLSMLIGTLGRPWLGELIESQGFYTVFIITFWLGGVAVVLSALEWIRQARSGSEELVLQQGT